MTDKNRLAWRSLPPQDAATGVPRKTSAFLRVDQVENGHGRNRRLFHGLGGVRPSVFGPEPGQVGPPRDGGPSVVIA